MIEEWLGEAYVVNVDGSRKIDLIKFSLPFQSEMTNLIASQLFESGSCNLTPYETSSQFHVPFIKSLLSHMNKLTGNKTEICPIT